MPTLKLGRHSLVPVEKREWSGDEAKVDMFLNQHIDLHLSQSHRAYSPKANG